MRLPHDDEAPFRLRRAESRPIHPLVQRFAAPLEQLLGLPHLNAIHADVGAQPTPQAFLEALLLRLGVQLEVAADDLARIPATGPVIVMANHPFGAIESLLLAALLLRVRPDARIMANALIERVPELRSLFIFVNPFGTAHLSQATTRGLHEAVACLNDGQMLGVFPAGAGAHGPLRGGQNTDAPWSASVARLVRRTGARVVPVYFDGTNSALLQLAGIVHPLLRTALLPRELLNNQGRALRAQIGSAITPGRLATFSSDAALVAYLRQRTYALSGRAPAAPADPRPLHLTRPVRRIEPTIPPVPVADLRADLARLPGAQKLAEHGELTVFCASAAQLPHILSEIGRLREVAFRATGEGTGKALDLDRYDETYRHLFIWQRAKGEVVGAYRLGLTDEIMRRQGLRGLYTHSLFDYPSMFIARISPAIELGRSFVRPEYQRSFAPLLMLWRGIGQFVMRHPRYRTLFGPVSISSAYAHASRELIAAFLRAQHELPELARMVRPRRPLRRRAPPGWSPHTLSRMAGDVEHLDEIIQDLEADRKGVPILIKQYLKLGARMLACNVDRTFSNALDAMIITDLMQTDERALLRYVSAEQLAAFRAFHGAGGNSN